ncbi:MAG: cysteine hydrolase [Ruminococcus sp.]|nr:cysteine hydrolase [Ruminococcus sp.]
MKLLAVIDMQNDFIDGSLGTNEAVKIVDSVSEKIEHMRQKGNKIVFTRDTHHENYLNTCEGKKLPVEHCIQGRHGWEISEKLNTDGAVIIDKPTFGSYDLAEYAASIGNLDEIILVGLCTDICVISNALLLKAKLPEVKITVDSSCCAGVTPQSHEIALEAMKMCQIDVI